MGRNPTDVEKIVKIKVFSVKKKNRNKLSADRAAVGRDFNVSVNVR